jgi:hypothetical protein
MSPDYLESQKEEVDVLEAIYQDDFKDKTKPSAWNVCIDEVSIGERC